MTEEMEKECKSHQDLSWKTLLVGGIAQFRGDQEFRLRDWRESWRSVASLWGLKLGDCRGPQLSQTCHPKGYQTPLFKAAEISSILLQSEVH